MTVSAKSKWNLKAECSSDYDEYKRCIGDLIRHKKVLSMEEFVQHADVSCLEHSIYVSYISYLVSRKLRLDYCSAARGGLLHDFFLYDWHVARPEKGLHGFVHPRIALENAERYFTLNKKEKDIIIKHMWPLTVIPPRYPESYVVVMADKYCTLMEMARFGRKLKLNLLGSGIFEA